MTLERLAEIKAEQAYRQRCGFIRTGDERAIDDLLAEVERLRAALRDVAATTGDPDVFRTVVEATHE